MLPNEIKSRLEKELGSKITGVKYAGGGSINQCAILESAKGKHFVKWNHALHYPGMFDAESKGLKVLKKHCGFMLPEVLATGTEDVLSFLLMTYLEKGPVDWEKAGRLLAELHSVTSNEFGFDHNNYIGSLPQYNNVHTTWGEFFVHQRLMPQIELAIDEGKLDHSDLSLFEKFFAKVHELFPVEKPSLLHGDLWSGNMLFSNQGPAIYDPAVYFGHREMDIAMTKLFGGFPESFYVSYNEVYPMEKGWQKRIDYCNLYPLLVHVNLFGGGYVNDVRNILRHFT